MKRKILIILSIFMIILIAGCADSGSNDSGTGSTGGSDTGIGGGTGDGGDTGPDGGDGTVTVPKGEGISLMNFGKYTRTFISPDFPQTSVDNIKILVNDNQPIKELGFNIHFKSTDAYARGEYETLLTDYDMLKLRYKIPDTDVGMPVEVADEMLQTEILTENKRVELFNALENSNYYPITFSSCGWKDGTYGCMFNGINQIDNIHTRVGTDTNHTELINQTYKDINVPYRNYKNLINKQDNYKWTLFVFDNRKYLAPDVIDDKEIELLQRVYTLSPYPTNTKNNEENILNLYLPADYNKDLLKIISGSRVNNVINFDNSNPNAPVLIVEIRTAMEHNDISNEINPILDAIQKSGYYTNITTTPDTSISYDAKKIYAESEDHKLEIYPIKNENDYFYAYSIYVKFTFNYDISTAPTIKDITK